MADNSKTMGCDFIVFILCEWLRYRSKVLYTFAARCYTDSCFIYHYSNWECWSAI